MTWMRSIAQDGGAPTGIRVVMAVAHLNATDTKATPAEVGRLLGIERSAANHALRRAAKGIEGISNDGGSYSVKGVGVTDSSSIESDVSITVNDGSVTPPMTNPSLGDDGNVTGTSDAPAGASVTIFPSYPTGIQGVDAQAPAPTRETPDDSKASSWPTVGTTTTYPDGFADVLMAWQSLTAPNGVQYATQVKAATKSVLLSITEEHGAALTLQGIASIEASHRSHRPPMPHWVRDRIVGIKDGAGRNQSKAMRGRGGCNDLLGTAPNLTPEQSAAARKAEPGVQEEFEATMAKWHEEQKSMKATNGDGWPHSWPHEASK